MAAIIWQEVPVLGIQGLEFALFTHIVYYNLLLFLLQLKPDHRQGMMSDSVRCLPAGGIGLHPLTALGQSKASCKAAWTALLL